LSQALQALKERLPVSLSPCFGSCMIHGSVGLMTKKI
jgi:hypothetical protein